MPPVEMGTRVLRAVDHRVEFRDGRGQLELHAQIVDQRRTQHGRLAQLLGIGAAAEDAVHGGQAVAAHDAVGVGVVEAIDIAAEEEIVLVVDLMIQAEKSQPAAIVADEVRRARRARSPARPGPRG